MIVAVRKLLLSQGRRLHRDFSWVYAANKVLNSSCRQIKDGEREYAGEQNKLVPLCSACLLTYSPLPPAPDFFSGQAYISHMAKSILKLPIAVILKRWLEQIVISVEI